MFPELPDLGPYDRFRVDVPEYPGALASSDYGSVLAEPPAAGVRYRVEEPPSVDLYTATEAMEALAVAPWHADGADGSGVRVAVFDVQWFNAEALSEELGTTTTQDCEAHRSCDPAMDTLRPRYTWEEGSHGVACAEVIRDIAPGAELFLVRVNGLTTFENAVEWAIRNEIDVVSMSMSFFNNSFHDGTGALNEAASRLAANGVLLVNSAGNYRYEHWTGVIDDLDRDGDLDFPWGSSYLPVYLGAGNASLQVSWDEFNNCGNTDLDTLVYDSDGDLVGGSSSVQDGEADSCSPIERPSAHAEDDDWYYLRLVRVHGGAPVRVGIFARGNTAYDSQPGSMADPSSSPSTFTVGAVRADGYAHNNAESFSSRGPSRGGFDKPDIAGPDGLSTRTYGPTGFYGTSASTPAVAAAVAVRMSAAPGLSPREAADELAANTLGGQPTWEAWDGALGAGRARLWDPHADNPCGAGGAAALAPLLWWGRFRRRDACWL